MICRAATAARRHHDLDWASAASRIKPVITVNASILFWRKAQEVRIFRLASLAPREPIDLPLVRDKG